MKILKLTLSILICASAYLGAEDCVKIVKANDEQAINNTICDQNALGFTLVDIEIMYKSSMNGSLSGNPLGTFLFPTDHSRYDQLNSYLDGSFTGQLNGSSNADQLLLRFHK